jgi:ATP-binding cassette subfamily F protein uup
MGNYSEYLDTRRQEQEAEALSKRHADKAQSVPASDSRDRSGAARGTNRPRRLSYKEQKEWEEIESRIAALEERSAALKQAIAEAGSDYAKVEKLFAEEQQVSAELEAAIDRWAELSALIEEIERSK